MAGRPKRKLNRAELAVLNKVQPARVRGSKGNAAPRPNKGKGK